MSEVEANWVKADGGYELALVSGKILCKNAKGKILASVPAKVRKSDKGEELVRLRDWLKTHQQECRDTVEMWMLRSLPVPREVLVAVWPDPAWRSLLENALVAPRGEDLDEELTGFLRDVDDKKGLGIVNLDGETVWLDAQEMLIPHPILIAELDDFRELAVELNVEQGLPQLMRETFEKPEKMKDSATAIGDFAEGKFEALNHCLGKCRTLGYRVSGGFACCPVWEGGELFEARYWIGADYPENETYTGQLGWVNEREQTLAIGKVGPVAVSEGMRMASSIYAARKVEEEGEDKS